MKRWFFKLLFHIVNSARRRQALQERSRRGSREKFERALAKVKNTAPEPRDAL